MPINSKLRDAIAAAIDNFQKTVEPNLMTGDIIDTCTEISEKLETALVRLDVLDDPWPAHSKTIQ
jgi:hypothetical protein